MDVKEILDNRKYIQLNKIKLKGLDKETRLKLALRKIQREKYFRYVSYIVDLFNKNKIPFVLLKSAKDVYVDGYEFFQGGDIDLFVRKKDFDKVDLMFRDNGYNTKEYGFSEEYLKRFSFHFRYSRKGYDNPVEVHWDLIDRVYPIKFDNALIWNKRVVKVKNYLYKLKPEFEALYLIISTFRDFGEGYEKNLFRIKYLFEHGFDFKTFKQYQRYHNLERFVKCFFGKKKGVLCRLFWNKVDGRIKENLFYHYLFLLLLFPGFRYWWYYLKKGIWFNLRSH